MDGTENADFNFPNACLFCRSSFLSGLSNRRRNHIGRVNDNRQDTANGLILKGVPSAQLFGFVD